MESVLMLKIVKGLNDIAGWQYWCNKLFLWKLFLRYTTLENILSFIKCCILSNLNIAVLKPFANICKIRYVNDIRIKMCHQKCFINFLLIGSILRLGFCKSCHMIGKQPLQGGSHCRKSPHRFHRLAGTSYGSTTRIYRQLHLIKNNLLKN